MTKKKPEAEAAAPAVVVDSDVLFVERAFAAGNFSMVRKIAASSSSPSAKEAALRLFPRMNVEKSHVLTGLLGLTVILIAAALSLVTG